jgi:hypothetical protein
MGKIRDGRCSRSTESVPVSAYDGGESVKTGEREEDQSLLFALEMVDTKK